MSRTKLHSVSLATAALAGTVGAGILIYLWVTLGDRGLSADANHTAGYTTSSEIALGLLGLVLVLGSAVGITVLLSRRRKAAS